MTEPNDTSNIDLDTTGEAEARSEQRRKFRDRMSDVGLIATMAFATIVAVGAILAWALFTGDDNGGDLGSGSSPPTTQELDVSLGEFWVKPASIEVAPNTTLVLNVTNDGAQTHDLKIGSKATPILNPGESAVLTTTAIEATIQGYCTLPGHEAAGMVMDIIVVGDQSAETQQVSQSTGGGGIGAGIGDDNATIDKSAEPGDDFERFDPYVDPAPEATTHTLTIEATDVVMEVAPGVTQLMWTFNDTVPGPTLRGKVGDIFEITLVNKGAIGHSIDFHASQTSMDEDMRTIQPGESLVYTFEAHLAGAWMYHCGTPPVLHHIANGMYGLVIIDPADGLEPVDHEIGLVQSELYLGPEGAESDLAKAEWGFQDAVVFNGYYNQYVFDPIEVATGDRMRVWIVNVGPNEISAFHIVGTQFDTVFKEGTYLLERDNPQKGGSQAIDLAPSQGGFVEFDIPKPGQYAMVTHKFNDAERGATGLIIAE